MEYYTGLDVGGTSVKGVLVDKGGNILAEDSRPTGRKSGGDGVLAACAELAEALQKVSGKTVCAVGVGCAGVISPDGDIVFAANLGIRDYPLSSRLSAVLGVPVKATNDANAAALGEAKFGAGKQYSDSVFVTLGTGVGGGIIIGGKLFEGGMNAGAEIGHTVIERGGELCTCGRRGCFEAYSSATALIKATVRAMEKNPDSAMWSRYNLQTATGRTAFDFADCDKAAKEVVDRYIDYLACGIINLANVFRPQAVIIGGGVSAQGDNLTVPLQRKLDAEIFGANNYAPVKVTIAALGNRAGALGAAALAMGVKL